MKTKRRKILALSSRQERTARGTRRGLLRVERETLAALREASARATDALLRVVAFGGEPRQLKMLLLRAASQEAEALRGATASAVLAGRRAARRLALQRLAAELGDVARELHLASLDAPPSGSAADDEGASQSAGESFAAAVRVAISAVVLRWAREQNGDLARAVRTAMAAQEHRLHRIAATEIPRAYQSEHADGEDWIREQYADRDWLPLLVKRWDATLDRKLCSVCGPMHGRWTMIGLSFDGLEPGHVHPNCRCSAHMIVLPLPMREQQAAAADDIAA